MRLHPAFGELSARAGANALAALEKDVVARAGGLSNAALIAEGLHVLPDFIGSRSPLADPGARGGVVGMDLREDAASLQELYVAGLCGLAYGVADIVRKLERAGYDFDSIVVSGGAARSALVRQIIADVCGKTVERAGDAGAGAAGLGDDRRRRSGHADASVSAMSAMSTIALTAAPAGGAFAAFHARKRRAFEILRQAEREIREDDARGRAGPKSSFSIATACWSTAR